MRVHGSGLGRFIAGCPLTIMEGFSEATVFNFQSLLSALPSSGEEEVRRLCSRAPEPESWALRAERGD